MYAELPITYETLLNSLKATFREFDFQIKTGIFEPYIHVRTKHLLIGFNIWYSAKDKTLEITDTIPVFLFNTRYRDRVKPILDWDPRPGTRLLYEINRPKRRKFKRMLENHFQRTFEF